MPQAALKIAITPESEIDATLGVVRSCRLAEVGRLAVFAGKDGKPKELNITPGVIDALLSLSQKQGRLDAFWTHDRMNNGGADELHDMIGVWRHFSKDESGNLIADLQLAPSDYRDRILWAAQNDPQGMMTSLVFKYEGGKDDAKPTAIFSGDIVRFGAATTALLSAYSETQPDTDMTPEEIKALVAEGIRAALAAPETRAALAAHNPVEKPDTAALAAAETEAGVLPEDRKADDSKLGAHMASSMAIHRATLRKSKAAEEGLTVKIQTAVLGQIGGQGFNIGGGNGANLNDAQAWDAKVNAQLESMPSGKKDRSIAILRVRNDNPELYNKVRALGRAA